MTIYLTNGIQTAMLPPVFYDDYNRPSRNAIVDFEEKPQVGDQITLRDFSKEFQSECLVIQVTRIAATQGGLKAALGTQGIQISQDQVFVELEQTGPIEYLSPPPF